MTRLCDTYLAGLLAVLLGMNRITHAQCREFSVEVFAGPDCAIVPSWAGASGISDTGAICGGYVDCGDEGHHVIWWPDGEMTEMPASADGGVPDLPFAINWSGQVAGRMYVPNLVPNPDRAFLYATGITQNLGTLPGGNFSEASAINAGGIVCGYAAGIGLPLTAFAWQDGKMFAIPLPLGESSVALDLSDSGLVCGWMGESSLVGHAFIHDLATGQTIDAGILLEGATGSQATGVNNVGTICGRSRLICGEFCVTFKGFIWSNGTVQDLGVLPRKTRTLPQAINDSNVIVGYCDPGGSTAFVWQNSVMQALNDLIPPELNLNIREAWDINNAGQIVAQATRPGPNGTDTVAVRLTPIPSAIGDFDFNCIINVDDLLGVINHWNKTTGPADFTQDGIVNHADLAVVIENWTL